MKIISRSKYNTGFTLLEVMIAVSILVMFLVPILGAMTQGLQSVTSSKNRTLATQLARNMMTEIELAPFPEFEGADQGDFGSDYGDYSWRTQMFEPPELAILKDQFGIQTMEVHLEVIWDESGAQKSLEISTLLVQ